MKPAKTHHPTSARQLNLVYTPDALDSFDTHIQLRAAVEQLHDCTNKILSILKGIRDDGSTREIYLRLAKRFHNAYEVVEDEGFCGFFIPPEIQSHIGHLNFEVLLESSRFQDENKLGVYHVKDAFNPKGCIQLQRLLC